MAEKEKEIAEVVIKVTTVNGKDFQSLLLRNQQKKKNYKIPIFLENGEQESFLVKASM